MQLLAINLPAYISLDRGRLRLRIERNGEEVPTDHLLPIANVDMVLLDHSQITITSGVLAKLAEEGIAVITTNRSHLPQSIALPLSGHSEQNKRTVLQTKATPKLSARLWRYVVKSKITIQAALLNQLNLPYSTLAQSATKGLEVAQYEGSMARIYFATLFGKNFCRQTQQRAGLNGLLDYGYALLYAAMARQIAIKGLSNVLAIYHVGRGNPFGLASDLMEPYRPYVDRIAYSLGSMIDLDGAMRSDSKQMMAMLFHNQVKSQDGKKKITISSAIEATVMSYIEALESKKADCLYYPDGMLPPTYEMEKTVDGRIVSKKPNNE